MIHVKEAVVVEGKYDKITLENVIDAVIIPVGGFSIFKDKERCELLRVLSQKEGIIVLTDSDSAGQMIRSHLKKVCTGGKVTHVYVPTLRGKEKRKRQAGKEGLLGVEGMSEDVLLEAFRQSGVLADSIEKKRTPVTKMQLYGMGLSGGVNSRQEREELCAHLRLPTKISANAFLDMMNALYGLEEFEKVVSAWRQDKDKK